MTSDDLASHVTPARLVDKSSAVAALAGAGRGGFAHKLLSLPAKKLPHINVTRPIASEEFSIFVIFLFVHFPQFIIIVIDMYNMVMVMIMVIFF